MATYIEKHTIVTKDTLNVDHDNRETFQHVKFMNPKNVYMGTFMSTGYKFEDLVSHDIYEVVLSGGYAVISGDNSEVAIVNADQIKDFLDERTVSSYGAIPSLPLISALNNAINKKIAHLDNSAAKLSGNNDISGYNRIEELDISSLSAAQTIISSLVVENGLSTNMLSVQSLNDIIADGETLSSVLSDIGADVEALEDEMHAADLSIILKLNNAVDNLIDREDTISAQLSDEVIQLSTNLSNDIGSLSAALSNEIQLLSGQLSDEVEQLSSSLSNEVIQLSTNLSTDIDSISAALSTDYVYKIGNALTSANNYTDIVSAMLSTDILNVSVAAEATPTDGYLKTYTITQGGIERGKIDIPKDFLVKSGSVETVVTPGQPYPDAKVGDKYIDLVINSKDDTTQDGTHLYIPANSLVDIYEGYSGICITTNVDGNIISADINSNSIAKDKLSSDVLSSLSLADSSLQLSDIVDISASTESVNAAANAYNVKKELTTLSSYITTVKYFDNNPVSAQLSVIKLSADDYYDLVAADATISNALYVVEDNKIDAYGQQIKNVAAPTDLSDVATKEYVDGGLSRKQDIIADLEEIRLSAANALPLSDVVDVDAESTTGKAADAESTYGNLSALSSYITTIKYFDNDPVSAQLSVVKLSAQDYYDLVVDDAAVSNVVYVVEDTKIDAYGQQIKNVADPTELSDATTKQYVDYNLAKKQNTIPDLEEIRLSAANALPISEKPEKLPNPYALSVAKSKTEYQIYDGSAALSINIGSGNTFGLVQLQDAINANNRNSGCAATPNAVKTMQDATMAILDTPYSTTQAYNIDDTCTYNGKWYTCISKITGPFPHSWTDNEWKETSTTLKEKFDNIHRIWSTDVGFSNRYVDGNRQLGYAAKTWVRSDTSAVYQYKGYNTSTSTHSWYADSNTYLTYNKDTGEIKSNGYLIATVATGIDPWRMKFDPIVVRSDLTFTYTDDDSFFIVGKFAFLSDIAGKADKKIPAANGNLAKLDASGNLNDTGKKLDDFVLKSDNPVRIGLDTSGDIGVNAVAIGRLAKAYAERSVAIGGAAATAEQTSALAKYSVALGPGAKVDSTAQSAVQLGSGTNTKKYSLQFRDCLIAKPVDDTQPPSANNPIRIISANLDKSFLETLSAISWSDLKAKRDGDMLIPGQQYRITDYVATTNGNMDSQSANHPFDIIVTADDEHKLNEHARAVMHDGDLPDDIIDGNVRTKYFAKSNLAAWDVWYCIDNDTNRFAWAVAEGGKGVIYRLVDEFQNDVPYDFKGIQFKAYGDTDDVYRFTFDAARDIDSSLKGQTARVYRNRIAPFLDDSDRRRALNRIVFKVGQQYANIFGPNCHSNTFGGLNCYNNVFGAGCTCNTFGSSCYNNRFGQQCSNNAFQYFCYGNTFGARCTNNQFDRECHYNTIDSDCDSNIFNYGCQFNVLKGECADNSFGMDCCYNTVGQYCDTNEFGTGCSGNTIGPNSGVNVFGNRCEHNNLGAGSQYNTFGDSCSYNTLGQGNNYNTFGSNCGSNTFGANCNYIKFGNASSTTSYCSNICVAAGNQHIYINPTGTSSSAYYQNVEITEGMSNKTINDTNVNQNFLTTYQPANSIVISI